MLVRVDAADLLEACWPGGAGDQEVLVVTVALERRQQLRVHKVHPDLADAGVAGHHAEVAGAGHVVMARVVRVYEVDKIVLLNNFDCFKIDTIYTRTTRLNQVNKRQHYVIITSE